MSEAGVAVWDRIVRLTHWGVAAAVLFDLMNESGPVHRATGYGAAALVLLRIVHGLFARPGSFAALPLPGFKTLRAHAVEVFAGRVHRSLGHNPLGQWMAYLLWVLILTLALTGWMSRLDEFWGEEWLTDLHEALADGLMACLAVHLLGVAAMSRMQGENLVRAMITGRKRA